MCSSQKIITVIAVALAALGLIMTFAYGSLYTSPAFRWTFSLLPRRVWGVSFLLAGVLTATDHHRPVGRFAGAALTLLCAVYGLTLLFAVWSGDASSGTGWIWPCTVAAVLMLVRPLKVKPE